MNESYNIDCMEYMAGCQDNQFDLAVVDPNYGIGEDGGQRRRYRKSDNHNHIVVHKKKDWDKKPPHPEYFMELFRVSKNQIICGANYFTDKLPPSMGWIFWDKNIGGDFSDGELIFTSFNRALRKIKISQFNGLRGGHDRIHPTQKPVALYKWILQNYAKPGWSILDTHEGSASNKIACHDMGFDYTGCELDQDYYKAAKERFKNHVAQKDLFSAEEYQYLMYTQGEI